MFSFTRLQGADPILRVEMASTGEVAAFAWDPRQAYLKALLSTGFKLPKKNILISAGSLSAKLEFLPSVLDLVALGFNLFGTPGTCRFYGQHDIPITTLHKPHDSDKTPNVLPYLAQGKIDCVVNIPRADDKQGLTDGYKIRRTAVDSAVSLISNIKCAVLMVEAIRLKSSPDFEPEVLSWDEYLNMGPSRTTLRARQNSIAQASVSL
jgi:hypothetical protein